MPIETILCAGVFVRSFPPNMMEPCFACTSPVMVWSIVVLPAPLAPMSAIISPCSTSKEMPLMAFIAP